MQDDSWGGDSNEENNSRVINRKNITGRKNQDEMLPKCISEYDRLKLEAGAGREK